MARKLDTPMSVLGLNDGFGRDALGSRYFNRRRSRARRRELRSGGAKAEHRLWSYLQRTPFGARFRRQYCVDAYVLDFYAPRLKLAIEIAGTGRFTALAKEHDRIRTAHLGSLGIAVIRFTSSEILGNIDRVLDRIAAEVLRGRTAAAPPRWHGAKKPRLR